MTSFRVLHLIDPGSAGGGPCAMHMHSELVAQLNDDQHDVLVLGTQRDVLHAQACGVAVDGQFCPPRFAALAGRKGLARSVATMQQHRGEYDVVHAWSLRSAGYASAALPHLPRVGMALAGAVEGMPHEPLANVLARSSSVVLAATHAVQDSFTQYGFDAKKMLVLPGAVAVPNHDGDARKQWRARWGVDDDVFVIGAICEPSRDVDYRATMRAIVSLNMTGRRAALVVPDDATRRSDAVRWARKLGLEHTMILDALACHPWRMAAGLDAAWWLSASTASLVKTLSPLPAWLMMAARVPMIADATVLSREMLDDGRTGFLVSPGELSELCDRMAKLADDAAHRRELASAAFEALPATVDPAVYAQEVRDIYQRLSG
jgi:hypothetical protein